VDQGSGLLLILHDGIEEYPYQAEAEEKDGDRIHTDIDPPAVGNSPYEIEEDPQDGEEKEWCGPNIQFDGRCYPHDVRIFSYSIKRFVPCTYRTGMGVSQHHDETRENHDGHDQDGYYPVDPQTELFRFHPSSESTISDAHVFLEIGWHRPYFFYSIK